MYTYTQINFQTIRNIRLPQLDMRLYLNSVPCGSTSIFHLSPNSQNTRGWKKRRQNQILPNRDSQQI